MRENLLDGCTNGQIDAITRKDEPGFIMAGAGTGKTFTLSRRIAFQMTDEVDPLDPEKLMAITFTEAAAAELLDRARRTAKAAGAEDARKIAASWTSTIHAMCRRLLSENALDARLDPGLVMMTDTQTATMLANVVEEAIENSDQALMRRLVRLVGGYEKVAGMLVVLMSISARTPGGISAVNFGPCLAGMTAKAWLSAESSIREAIAVYDEVLPTKKGKTIDGLKSDIAKLETLLKLGNAGKWNEMGASDLKLASRVSETSDAKKEVASTINQVISSVAIDEDIDLVPFVRELALETEHLMTSRIRDEHCMTFDALLSECYRLLEDDDLAREYSTRFSALLIDEFQDTDPIQASIAKRLCEDDAGLGKVMTVGDRQQSIYGFRGAEVSVSDDMQVEMEAVFNDATIELDVNFRSHPDILSFVGAVFSSDSFFGDDFLDLEPAEDNSSFTIAGDELPAVELVASVAESSSKTAIAVEADYVAARFKELYEADPDLSYDGMALILRSFTNVETYINAFREAGIPSAITGGRRFYSFDETASAIQFLRVLRDPEDDLALYKLLISEMFRISDEDVIVLKSVFNEAVSIADDDVERPCLIEIMKHSSKHLPESIQEALNLIETARDALSQTQLSIVFRQAFRSSGWEETMYLDKMSYAGKTANIAKFADMIEELEAQYGLDWTSIVDDMIAAADAAESFGGKDNAETPGRTVGRGIPGCVSIMTIHASKGLEYDVVAAVRLESGVSRGTKVLATTSQIDGNRIMNTALDLWGVASDSAKGFSDMELEDIEKALNGSSDYLSFMSAIKAKKDLEEQFESKRLVYVALTRAKKKLIWVAGLNVTQKGTFGANEKIFRDAVDAASDVDLLAQEASSYMTHRESPFSLNFIAAPIEIEEACGQVSYERACTRDFKMIEYGTSSFEKQRKIKVVSFSSAFKDTPLSAEALSLLGEHDCSTSAGTSQPRSSEAAMAFGNAFHECARRLALTGNVLDLDSVKKICAENETEEYDEVFHLVSELSNSDLWNRIRKSDMYSAEYPLRYRLEDICLNGIMDVMFRENGHATIIDYKTGCVGLSDAEVVEGYGYQALVYAAGVLSDDSVESVSVMFVLVEDNMRLVETPTWTTSDVEALFKVLEDAN